MKTLVFLSRVTFIYNLCMLVTLIMGYFNFMPEKGIKSSIVVAGLFLSIVFNGVANLGLVFLLIKKQSFKIFQPAWLFIANFLCFIFQLYMVLK